jgi:hypothetical protein
MHTHTRLHTHTHPLTTPSHTPYHTHSTNPNTRITHTYVYVYHIHTTYNASLTPCPHTHPNSNTYHSHTRTHTHRVQREERLVSASSVPVPNAGSFWVWSGRWGNSGNLYNLQKVEEKSCPVSLTRGAPLPRARIKRMCTDQSGSLPPSPFPDLSGSRMS